MGRAGERSEEEATGRRAAASFLAPDATVAAAAAWHDALVRYQLIKLSSPLYPIPCLVCLFRHPVSWMGRPRGGKGRKSIEAAKTEDGSSGGEEEVIPAYKRRGRPQKHHLKDDHADEEEDDNSIAKTEEEDDDIAKIDAAKTIAPPVKAESKVVAGSAHNPGRKRRRQLKRGADSAAMEEKDKPSSRQNGFRQHGSRRKNSTPRRAAEAGVECK
ncbi:hypothetical protein E2562_016444 [Oryza meyeriana var. granulata]|uniref:Uncharacterized protein n=1 Tax=Oryza meyeriana var. granulata TaxID=110450 RepID=A0A6G1EX81_9ORYZ|nr:hypothetical protein E2562_016444 [Oryza meyeriana var. granulata]